MKISAKFNKTEILNKCRICLLKNGAWLIFTLYGKDKLDIRSLYESYTGLKVEEGDKMPKSLCRECLHCLIETHTFISKCKTGDTVLRSFETVLTLDQPTSYKVVVIEGDTTIEFEYDCSDEQSVEIDKENETVEDEDLEKSELTEIVCKDLIANDLLLTDGEHVLFSKDDVEEQVVQLPTNTCSGSEFSTIKEEYQSLCVGDEKDENILQNESSLYELNNDSWQEPTNLDNVDISNNISNPKSSDEELDMNNFDMREDKDISKTQRCTVCLKGFKRKDTLINHMRIHTHEKPFRCSVCSAEFSSGCNLTRHTRVHTGEKPYVCDICGKGSTPSTSAVKTSTEHSDGLNFDYSDMDPDYVPTPTNDLNMTLESDALDMETTTSITIVSKKPNNESNESPKISTLQAPIVSVVDIRSLTTSTDKDKQDTTKSDMKKVERLPFKIPEYLNAEVIVQKKDKKTSNKKNRHFCLYCHEEVTNFPRHLRRKHKTESAVRQLLKKPLGSVERKRMTDVLRKRGNFLTPIRSKITLVKSPVGPVTPANILPCVYCKGYYMRKTLSRHVKRCFQRPSDKSHKNFNASESQTFIAFHCSEDNFINSLSLKDDILSMRCDEISLIAKSDPLILSFGSFYRNNHPKRYVSNITRSKMRALARLWLNMKSNVKEASLFEALKPDNFEQLVESTQIISGYQTTNNQYLKAPSLANNMRGILRQLCTHALFQIEQNSSIFISGTDSVKKAEDIKTLRELIEKNWNTIVNSMANEYLIGNLRKNPSIIELVSNITRLNKFAEEKGDTCVEQLKVNNRDQKMFLKLQKCCYTLLVTSNANQMEDLQRIEFNSYIEQIKELVSEDFDHVLTDVEKLLFKECKRIRILGKHLKYISISISKKVQSYITLLLSVRENFVPKTNPYLFAKVNSDTYIYGNSLLKNLVLESEVEHINAIVSGNMTKNITAISRINNLDPLELNQLCSILGHTVDTQHSISRTHPDVQLTAKLVKHILKSRDEDVNAIDLNEELASEEDSESDDDKPRAETNYESQEPADDSSPIPKKKVVCVGSPKAKHIKIRWTEEQKSITRKFFKTNINKKKPPTESEIKIFLEKFPAMANKDWKKVKAFVFNEYNLKK